MAFFVSFFLLAKLMNQIVLIVFVRIPFFVSARCDYFNLCCFNFRFLIAKCHDLLKDAFS